ncbi:MAG: 30S ribosomal protein S16 [Bdellovibrionales bacterium]|nr:30S ribosomal protein S16 [Bdellovibrionales bacterium]
MSVVIRLARGGCRNNAKYRITVADSRKPHIGKFLEILGYYNPVPSGNDKEFELNLERANYWMSKGALPTDRVKSIIQQAKKLN